MTVTVREATQADIPALVSLFLTSFRQFPLVKALYTPIQDDIENARDTLFYQQRFMLLGLLDPDCTILVAQCPRSKQPQSLEEIEGEDYEASKAMHQWLTETIGISQEVQGEDACIVGYSIWWKRGVEAEVQAKFIGWRSWIQAKWIQFEVDFWRKWIPRRDIDHAKYSTYRRSEEKHEEKFYRGPCFQLDNLAVDFRFHRRGLGQTLVRPGLEKARKIGVDVNTEAGPMSEPLYKKMGFREVGTWTVELSREEEIVMPFMKYSTAEQLP